MLGQLVIQLTFIMHLLNAERSRGWEEHGMKD